MALSSHSLQAALTSQWMEEIYMELSQLYIKTTLMAYWRYLNHEPISGAIPSGKIKGCIIRGVL